MKIGIDARPLQHDTKYRGIGKALEFLLLSLKPKLKQADTIYFYVDSGLGLPKVLEKYPEAQVLSLPTSKLGRRRYFRSFMQSFKPLNPRRGSVDVVLQYDASFGIPKKVPSVIIFHDLIPYLFRGQEKQRVSKALRKAKDALARSMYWKKYLRVLADYQNATKIIAISNSSKKDILQHVQGVKSANVVVIGHGLNVLEATGDVSPKIRNLSKSPYLLYVGGIDIRKNIIGLLQTFLELKPKYPKLKLVMVGKEFQLDDQMRSLGWFDLLRSNPGYAKDVILPGFVTSAELAFLYEKAAAFVFPSRYEGFGFPVLEAMAAGCPVVAYDNSSIPEVAGDAALLVKDGSDLKPVIEKLLTDTKLRQQLIAKGYKQANKFSWDDTAQKILGVLKNIV